VQILRAALDRNGYPHVKIVASGGFDAAKIRRFEADGVPVDVYGVGAELLHAGGPAYDYTADIVRVEGRALGKVGRGYVENPRLNLVDWRSLTTASATTEAVQ
jgi:nicotinate phosphoribosyltransferase